MSSGQPSGAPASASKPSGPQFEQVAGTIWKSGPWSGLGFALLAGLIAWLIVQAVHPVFWTDKGRDEVGFLPLDVQWRLDRNNTMFVLALVGGLTCLAFAASEGQCRKSWRTALVGGAKCAAFGVLFGALAGYLGHRTFEFYKANAEMMELTKSLRVNGAMFATLGAGVGLGAGVVLGQHVRTAFNCLLGGLLAGALASFAYPLIVATLMQAAMTSVLLPLELETRLVWFGLVSGLLGAIVPAVARPRHGQGPPDNSHT